MDKAEMKIMAVNCKTKEKQKERLIFGVGALITGGILLGNYIFHKGRESTATFLSKHFPDEYSSMVEKLKEKLNQQD